MGSQCEGERQGAQGSRRGCTGVYTGVQLVSRVFYGGVIHRGLCNRVTSDKKSLLRLRDCAPPPLHRPSAEAQPGASLCLGQGFFGWNDTTTRTGTNASPNAISDADARTERSQCQDRCYKWQR